jgi:hypothetical protein
MGDFYPVPVTRSRDGRYSWCKDCTAQMTREVYGPATYQRMRLRVLSHYSGGAPACRCCGEDRLEFLALDHIDGNGNEHRRSSGVGRGGARAYRWAIRNGFPPIFRVLCHNCNMAIGFYGECPHERERSALVAAKNIA